MGVDVSTYLGQRNDNAANRMGRDYVPRDRTFFLEINQYRLIAANHSDRSFSFSRCFEEQAAQKFSLEDYRDGTEDSAARIARIMATDLKSWDDKYRPSSDTDRIDLGLFATLKSVRHHGLGFISPTERQAHGGGITLGIHTGLEAASGVFHYQSSRDPEMVFIAIYTNLSRTRWLHEQLISRPKATLQINCCFEAYQHLGSPEPKDHDVFYITRDSRTPITAVSILVHDGRSARDARTTPSARNSVTATKAFGGPTK